MMRSTSIAIIALIVPLLTGCVAETTYVPASGDIIFHTSTSEQSEAIQLATKSPYSHVGIVYIEDGKPYVFEAYKRVETTPLDEWTARGLRGEFVVKRLKNAKEALTPEALERMLEVGRGFEDRPYDLYFEWKDDRLYCSELVWLIYERALGIEIGELNVLGDFDLSHPAVREKLLERWPDGSPLDETVISPAAMFRSEQLVECYPRDMAGEPN